MKHGLLVDDRGETAGDAPNLLAAFLSGELNGSMPVLFEKPPPAGRERSLGPTQTARESGFPRCRRTKPLLALVTGLVIFVLGTGCSVKQMAVNMVGNALAGGGTTFASDNDPELVKAAVPFSLKLMESLLAQNPTHQGLLFASASGFTQYSYAFGIDPIHLGIIFLANLELGYLTPPVGMNLFLSSNRLNKPVLEVARSVIPILLVLLVGVLLITYVPALTTFLPGLLD